MKQREKEDWLKEPVSLQERLSELSNWGSYEGDDFVHPDRWFTGDNYINYHYEEIVDLLEEQKHEDD